MCKKENLFTLFITILLAACILYSKFLLIVIYSQSSTQITLLGNKSQENSKLYRWKKAKFKEKIPTKFSDFYKNELNVTKR